MHPEPVALNPIGIIRSCYGEKFGIPRQAGVVGCAPAVLELLPPVNAEESLREIERFSHLWIVFLFHRSERDPTKTTARPPRLGGNRRVGVFASRSPFRPNPIGLSAVRLERVEGTRLHLRGGDFLDGTPVLDVKPYLPYADAVPDACGGYAAAPPAPAFEVFFAPEADAALKGLEAAERPALRRVIEQMLSFDPLPAYQSANPERTYGTRLYDLDVRWRVDGDVVRVTEVAPAAGAGRPPPR